MIPTELKQKGYQVLVKELGQVDTIRFYKKWVGEMVIIQKSVKIH